MNIKNNREPESSIDYMKVLIFGGTGFIGKHLVPSLIKEGYEIILFTRNPDSVSKSFDTIRAIEWDGKSVGKIAKHFNGNYAIINLAGESIGSKLWTKKQKNIILNSRLTVTKAIVNAIQLSSEKPAVLLQGSAIGYYGSQSDRLLDERSDKGKGFLSDVVDAWEKSARSIESAGVRVIYLRTGVVLGTDGGALPMMLLPFKLFMGGHAGSGLQWMSWIHIADMVNAIAFLLKDASASGIYNLTSPEPLMMSDFSRLAGKALNRRPWFHVPAFIFKFLPKGMADDLFLISQKVFPARLMEAGFHFKFKSAETAFSDLIQKK
jgi:hypothetical protein